MTRGTLFLLIATLCYVGLNFVARVIITRTISTEEWSSFSLGLTIIGVVGSIGALGLTNAVARGLPYAPSDDERRAIVRGSVLISVLSAAVSSVGLFLLGPELASHLGLPDLGPTFELFPIAVATSVVIGILAAIFQGYEDVTPNALFVQILTPGFFVVFLGVAAVLPSRLTFDAALVAYVAGNAAALLLAIAYAVRRLGHLLPPGPRAAGAVGRLMTFAVPLFFVGLLGTLTGGGDSLVLGAYHAAEFGFYSNALTLARLLQVGIGAAAYIFLPVAARALRLGDHRTIELTYVTVTKWMILFSLPLFLLFFVLPGPSLEFVYGTQYSHATLPLQITVLGAFVTTVLGPAANAQVAFGQARLLAYNAGIAAAVDVGLAFVLVPGFGMTGAAVAWAIANASYTALSLVELAVLAQIHPFRPHFLVPLAVTALPVGAALALVPFHYPLWSLPILGVAIAGLFVLVVLGTRSIDEGDRLLLGAFEGLVGRPLPLLRRIGRAGLRRGDR